MKSIYVTDYLRRKLVISSKKVGRGFKIKLLQELDEKKLFPTIQNADALIVDKTNITQYTIDRLDHCKVIVRMGAGYDNVDIRAAAKKGIYVCNIPDFCTEEVADHALAFLLAMSRSLITYNNNLVKNKGKPWTPILDIPNQRLRGKKFGIIGLGRIGTAVALRTKALGLNVYFYDPKLAPGIEKSLGIQRVETLNELAHTCDIISFHVPLTQETKHMGNKAFFRQLKKGAYVINTSRGPVLDTKALLHALKTRQVEKAALDVFEHEPLCVQDVLFQHWLKETDLQKRLILTPHSAFYSLQAEEELKEKAINEVKRVLQGKKPLNWINKDN